MSIIKELCIGALKTTLNFIPHVGPALSEAFFETPSRIAQRRRDEYIDTFIEKIKKIPDNKIDHDYIRSEEFSDLIQYILKKVEMLRAKDRADFFSKLGVANTLKTRPKIALDWQLHFIEILANLNDSELKLLFALNNHRNPSAARISSSTPFGLEKAEFQLCFDSLLSKGLVYDASLKGLSKRTGLGSNPSPRERIDLSPLGKKIIQFVKEIEGK